MSNNFKKGSIVRLKSGSPKMTIDFIDSESGVVRCVWFVNDTDFHSNDFFPDSLILDE
ncbi:MAG: DUF2158 domain-containing protein [Flavobacteriaceae bacterium]